jgi:hypothetical protein
MVRYRQSDAPKVILSLRKRTKIYGIDLGPAIGGEFG